MRDKRNSMRAAASFILFLLTLIMTASAPAIMRANTGPVIRQQEKIPAPPADRALVYVRAENGELQPLPFETAQTPLRTDAVAKSDKVSRVELKGANAATILSNYEPHFYLFVPDEANPHPPLLVRLTGKKEERRVVVMAQRGLRGFAVASEEIIKPRYRVLGREGGMIFLEIWPRVPLLPGEYAFIGNDLARTPTFGVK